MDGLAEEDFMYDITVPTVSSVPTKQSLLMLTHDAHPAKSTEPMVEEDEAASVSHNQHKHVKSLLSTDKTKARATQSCLRDAILTLATARSHQPLLCDISVTRRDTVPAGFTGTRRAICFMHPECAFPTSRLRLRHTQQP